MDRVNDLEYRQAKKDGAKLVKNSGRGEVKGDAIFSHYLVDYKFTDGKSFSLNLEKYKKHLKDAVKQNLEPAIVIIFRSDNDRSLAIVDWNWLKDLM